MKRVSMLGVLLVAVLACTAAFSTPEPAHAILCCEEGYLTSVDWKMGTSCADAQAQYRAARLPEAQAECGGATKVCAFTLPPCYQSGNMWVVDGEASYGCRVDCGPPLP
jgi:hypothetical protein